MSTLDVFLDERFTYDFWQGPREVRTFEDALQNGINCISLAHLAIEHSFGFRLPPDLYCSELFLDTEHFIDIDGFENAEVGDLVWFGVLNPKLSVADFTPRYNTEGVLTNWHEFPVKHAGIIYHADESDPLILHSTHKTGTNSLWHLSEFLQYKRYRKVHGIKRFIIQD